MKQTLLKFLYALWKALAIFGCLICAVFVVLSFVALLHGFINGDLFSDDSMIVYIQEGPAFTYAMFYGAFFRAFCVAILWLISWIWDLRYLKQVKTAGVWIPGGKKRPLYLSVILHLVALAVQCIVG